MKPTHSRRLPKPASERLTPLKRALFTWANQDHGLTGGPANFIELVASFANANDATVWITRKEFAKAAKRISVRSITTYTGQARDLGLIEPTGLKARCGRELYRVAPNDPAVQAILDAANDNARGKSGKDRGKSCAAYIDDPQDHYFSRGAEAASPITEAELVPVPPEIRAIYRRVFSPAQMFSYIENARWHDATQSLFPATSTAAIAITQKDDGLSKALKFRIVAPARQVRHG